MTSLDTHSFEWSKLWKMGKIDVQLVKNQTKDMFRWWHSETTSQQTRRWKKWDIVNAMIIGWIYRSVEPKLRPSISLVDSAKIMWGSLQLRLFYKRWYKKFINFMLDCIMQTEWQCSWSLLWQTESNVGWSSWFWQGFLRGPVHHYVASKAQKL